MIQVEKRAFYVVKLVIASVIEATYRKTDRQTDIRTESVDTGNQLFMG